MSIKAIYNLFDGAFSLRMLRDRFVLKLKRPLYIDGVIMNSLALDVPAGRVPGKSALNKFGHGHDCDSGILSDIWSRNDITKVWIPPTQARIHNIVSTSLSDDASGGAPAGIGATHIRIYGLEDWDSKEVYEDIEMNGTVNVPTSKSYVIIHRMKVTNFGVGGPNQGRITATATVDGTVTAEIYFNATLSAGSGQTTMAIWGIPSIQTAYISKYYFSIINNISAVADSGILIATDPVNHPSRFTVKHRLGMSRDGSSAHEHPFNPYYKVPGPAIVKISAVPSANNVEISAGFDGYVEDN